MHILKSTCQAFNSCKCFFLTSLLKKKKRNIGAFLGFTNRVLFSHLFFFIQTVFMILNSTNVILDTWFASWVVRGASCIATLELRYITKTAQGSDLRRSCGAEGNGEGAKTIIERGGWGKETERKGGQGCEEEEEGGRGADEGRGDTSAK